MLGFSLGTTDLDAGRYYEKNGRNLQFLPSGVAFLASGFTGQTETPLGNVTAGTLRAATR